jgi:hypothetical protein
MIGCAEHVAFVGYFVGTFKVLIEGLKAEMESKVM